MVACNSGEFIQFPCHSMFVNHRCGHRRVVLFNHDEEYGIALIVGGGILNFREENTEQRMHDLQVPILT